MANYVNFLYSKGVHGFILTTTIITTFLFAILFLWLTLGQGIKEDDGIITYIITVIIPLLAWQSYFNYRKAYKQRKGNNNV